MRQTHENDSIVKYQQTKQKFESFNQEVDTEIKIKDALIKRLEEQIKNLQRELQIAKQIIKDPNLSKMVCR